jgi:tetratricopeptide (TPR) repeat protein
MYAEPHIFSPERDVWLERLEREEANLRAVLDWSKAESTAVQIGLRLAGALVNYWFLRGSIHEGRRWLEAMLERTDGTDRSVARGRALRGAGWMALNEGDYQTAALLAEESWSIVREQGDKRESGNSAQLLGHVRMAQHNNAAARPLLEASRSLFKELGDVWGEARTLYLLGMVAYLSGESAAARGYYQESLQFFRQLGDAFGVMLLVSALSAVLDEETARSLYEQSLPLLRTSSSPVADLLSSLSKKLPKSSADGPKLRSG